MSFRSKAQWNRETGSTKLPERVTSVPRKRVKAKDVSLAEACVAYLLLTGLSYVVSRLRLHSPQVASLLDADPVLLYFAGRFMHRALLSARMVPRDLEATVRKRGMASMAEVKAIVLEPDGEISVIGNSTGYSELLTGLCR